MTTTTTILALPIPDISAGSPADTDNYDVLMQTAEDNILANLETRLGGVSAPSAAEISLVKDGSVGGFDARLDSVETDLTSGSDPGHNHTDAFLSDTAVGATFEMQGNLNNPWASFGNHINLLLQSESFNTANWTKADITGGAITADGAVAPTGETVAENFSGTAATGAVSQSRANNGTGNYTFSVWLKMQADTGSASIILYDDATPVATNTTVCALTTTWQRFSVTTNHANAPTNKICKILCGTAAIAAWGAQLESGAIAGPYAQTIAGVVPTAAAAYSWLRNLITGNAYFSNIYLGASGFNTGNAVKLASTATVYAAGTKYALTNTAALLDFGTTDPTLTLPANYSSYILKARVRIDFTGTTFAANRTVTLKLRKTTGTAGDVANSTITLVTPVITTLTETWMVVDLPTVVFINESSSTIQIWGSIDVVPEAGTIDVVEASIIAIACQ